jgi:hypothetical protein
MPDNDWAEDFYELVTAGEGEPKYANASQNVMY